MDSYGCVLDVRTFTTLHLLFSLFPLALPFRFLLSSFSFPSVLPLYFTLTYQFTFQLDPVAILYEPAILSVIATVNKTVSCFGLVCFLYLSSSLSVLYDVCTTLQKLFTLRKFFIYGISQRTSKEICSKIVCAYHVPFLINTPPSLL
jgi:hypothetical protein